MEYRKIKDSACFLLEDIYTLCLHSICIVIFVTITVDFVYREHLDRKETQELRYSHAFVCSVGQ